MTALVITLGLRSWEEMPRGGGPGRYSWKVGIITTIFWIGERPSGNNPVPNDRSSWDRNWYYSYGGYDTPDPGARRNFIPVNFVPRQNPFYVALPYNDVEGGRTKAEASEVIPWFKQAFVRDGQTVLKGRWISIRHGNRVCYFSGKIVAPSGLTTGNMSSATNVQGRI